MSSKLLRRLPPLHRLHPQLGKGILETRLRAPLDWLIC